MRLNFRATVWLSALLLSPLLTAASLVDMGKHPYPDSWAPLEAGEVVGGCPKLDGTYENRAAAMSPSDAEDRPKLSDLLSLVSPTTKNGQSAERPDSSATAVTIAQVGETVTISFIDESAQPVSPLEFRKAHMNPITGFGVDTRNKFVCTPFSKNNAFRFLAEAASYKRLPTVPLYFEAGGTMLLLRKAADGSLIAQLHSDSVRISMVILGSTVHLDNVWVRYSRVGERQ